MGGTPGSGILCRTSPSDQCTLSRADGYASRYRSGAGTGTGNGGWGWNGWIRVGALVPSVGLWDSCSNGFFDVFFLNQG